jgi:hypothetical protein
VRGTISNGEKAMDKNELRLLIQQKDEEFERNKVRRTICVIIFYATVFFGIFWWRGEFNGLSVWQILFAVPICFFGAMFYVWANSLIFVPWFRKSEDENKALERLKKQLEEVEKDDIY